MAESYLLVSRHGTLHHIVLFEITTANPFNPVIDFPRRKRYIENA